jgi:hypothetical protein
MNYLSKAKLNEYITLYLNDVNDYGEDNEYIIAENALQPMKSLIVESEKNTMGILLETLRNASKQTKPVLEDFITYINSI